MRAKLEAGFLQTVGGREAEAIIRTCVHCGFCNATCPTYQLLGDELDGPRGRIYLIKSMLEGGTVSARTQRHLDRCLLCRACETTCPSGVRYGRLAELARPVLESRVPRGPIDRFKRWLLRTVIPYPSRFGPVLAMGRAVRPLLPPRLRRRVPLSVPAPEQRRSQHTRRVILMAGCVQRNTSPQIDAAAIRVFDRLGLTLVSPSGAGCCGAVSYHLGDIVQARAMARSNIDACWSLIEQGAEALMTTASGCGVMFKDYPELFADDPVYGERAQRIAALARDPVEIVEAELPTNPPKDTTGVRIACHCPCTLQHGLKLAGTLERLLGRLGFNLCEVKDGHLCCGSAGTYSLLQPSLSDELLKRKLCALQRDQPDLIVTANIGCLLHLEREADVPVKHWLEIIANLV